MSTDRWVIRAVVIGLIMVTIIIVIGALLLANQGKAIDDFFKMTASAALGALSALLAKTGYDHLVNVEQAEQVGPNPGPQPAPEG